jgi:hypothetical protein
MSNKAKPFLVTYYLEFSGRSKGWDTEETFMERMIENTMSATVSALSQFKTLKIKVSVNKEPLSTLGFKLIKKGEQL